MARRFEQAYRVGPEDGVIDKVNRVNEDLDIRLHTVEESTGKLDAAANEVRDRALNYFIQQIDPRFADLIGKLEQAQLLLNQIETGATTDLAALLAQVQQDANALLSSIDQQGNTLLAGLDQQATALIASLTAALNEVLGTISADTIPETADRKWLTAALKATYDEAVGRINAVLAGSDSALDTFLELKQALDNKEDAIAALTTLIGEKLAASAVNAWVLNNVLNQANAAGVRTAIAALGAAATGQTITGGFRTPGSALTLTGAIALDPGVGNVRYGNNVGAFTLNAPSQDGDLTLVVTNTGTAGAVTIGGHTNTDYGDAFDATNGSIFLVWQSRRAAGAINLLRIVKVK